MNYTPTFGWYYKDLNNRAPAWTGVEYLYNFMTTNEGKGPFAEGTPLNKLEVGDIVQLGTATGDFYHSPVVVAVREGRIFVAAHTFDAFMRPLSSYSFARARGIHILGVRSEYFLLLDRDFNAYIITTFRRKRKSTELKK